jgi:hypothetical protein
MTNDKVWKIRTECFLLDLQRYKEEFPELVKIATASAFTGQERRHPCYSALLITRVMGVFFLYEKNSQRQNRG